MSERQCKCKRQRERADRAEAWIYHFLDKPAQPSLRSELMDIVGRRWSRLLPAIQGRYIGGIIRECEAGDE